MFGSLLQYNETDCKGVKSLSPANCLPREDSIPNGPGSKNVRFYPFLPYLYTFQISIPTPNIYKPLTQIPLKWNLIILQNPIVSFTCSWHCNRRQPANDPNSLLIPDLIRGEIQTCYVDERCNHK